MMKIGDPVKVTRVIEFKYDDDNNRVAETVDVPEAEYFLTGIRFKPIGRYVKGTTYSIGFDEDYCPPELDIKGVVKVALVVKSLKNNPICVPYEDVAKQLTERR